MSCKETKNNKKSFSIIKNYRSQAGSLLLLIFQHAIFFSGWNSLNFSFILRITQANNIRIWWYSKGFKEFITNYIRKHPPSLPIVIIETTLCSRVALIKYTVYMKWIKKQPRSFNFMNARADKFKYPVTKWKWRHVGYFYSTRESSERRYN